MLLADSRRQLQLTYLLPTLLGRVFQALHIRRRPQSETSLYHPPEYEPRLPCRHPPGIVGVNNNPSARRRLLPLP